MSSVCFPPTERNKLKERESLDPQHVYCVYCVVYSGIVVYCVPQLGVVLGACQSVDHRLVSPWQTASVALPLMSFQCSGYEACSPGGVEWPVPISLSHQPPHISPPVPFLSNFPCSWMWAPYLKSHFPHCLEFCLEGWTRTSMVGERG